jgi:hypothetical protein
MSATMSLRGWAYKNNSMAYSSAHSHSLLFFKKTKTAGGGEVEGGKGKAKS